jgi:hypothetical protein
MDPKTCPSCQLVHRATATRCECGYDFDEERQTKPLVGHRRDSLPWHEEPLLAIASLVVCWPAGLILLWQNKHISATTKTIVMVTWFGLSFGFLAYRMSLARNQQAP